MASSETLLWVPMPIFILFSQGTLKRWDLSIFGNFLERCSVMVYFFLNTEMFRVRAFHVEATQTDY
jgi:hypothetical protein